MSSDFGAWLRAQRTERGWSLREAAEMIGISHNRVAEIEKGTSYRTGNSTRPSRELVERIARVYGVPVIDLLARAGYESAKAPALSADEQQALTLFQSLTAKGRQAALATLQVFVDTGL